MKLYCKSIVLLIVSLFSIVKINSQTLTLNALIYDNTPSRNPDFQTSSPGGVVQGLVKVDLGADGTPEFCCGNVQTASIHSQTTFFSWFHNVPGTNLPIQKDIILTEDPNQPGVYTYSNSTYFVIDGEGFDDPVQYPNEQKYYDQFGNPHNFHYCLQASTEFQYKAGDVFDFRGDDDVWVFINNKLVVDLGSIHVAASGSVVLDTLGLTVGQNYPFHFFYCERHTVQSNIKISTTLKFVCPRFDECGVCNGDGSSCCTPSNCNNNPIYKLQCIDAYCQENVCIKPPPMCTGPTPCQDAICVNGTGCVPKPRICSDNKFCTTSICNDTANGCVHNVIEGCKECTSIGCITIDLCNPLECNDAGDGCVAVPKNCDDYNFCTTDTCFAGVCIHTGVDNCTNCPGVAGCITTDACFPMQCPPRGSSTCVPTPKYCDDGKFCTIDTCSSGDCQYQTIDLCEECSVANVGCVTVDKCNPLKCNATGNGCDTIPKDCSDGDLCHIPSCQSPTGMCRQTPKNCSDGDECTINNCNPATGVCSNILIDNCADCINIGCITTDKCFPLICSDNGTNCVNTTKSCDDGNYCTTNVCVGPDGICENEPINNCIACPRTACLTLDLCYPAVCPDVVGGPCLNTTKNCDDNNFCTTDTCYNGICSNIQIENCVNCGSGPCITTDLCFPQICSDDGSQCVSDVKNCEDGNFCSVNQCLSPLGQCSNVPIPNCVSCVNITTVNRLAAAVAPGIGCITTDLCNPQQCNPNNDGCISVERDCRDGNNCTINSCNPTDGTCTNTFVPNCQNCTADSVGCTTTDFCFLQQCNLEGDGCNSIPLNCSDNNFCTEDLCTNGTCSHIQIANCTNCQFTGCISNDNCVFSQCSSDGRSCITIPNICNDNNPCTIDSCTQFGCLFEGIPSCVNCSVDLGCTTTDFCNTQLCNAANDGCISLPLDCNDNITCTTDTCLPNRLCSNVRIPGCIDETEPPTSPPPVGGPFTESGTTTHSCLCDYHHCKNGHVCEVINNRAECIPKNNQCLDCLDLNCQSNGMSCFMVENPLYSNKGKKKGCKGEHCCRFTPTCKQRLIK